MEIFSNKKPFAITNGFLFLALMVVASFSCFL